MSDPSTPPELQTTPFTTVIGPRRPLLAIDLRELWHYRDLVVLLLER